MADITVTAANVALIFPAAAEVYDAIAGATITAGQVVYFDSNGKAGVADANDAGKIQARGIALTGGGAGQGISILKKGHVAGFTISQAYDAIFYLSNTAGALADAAGGTSVPCGRVIPIPDGATPTKVFYANFTWLADFA